jgi:hypothetical protein
MLDLSHAICIEKSKGTQGLLIGLPSLLLHAGGVRGSHEVVWWLRTLAIHYSSSSLERIKKFQILEIKANYNNTYN